MDKAMEDKKRFIDSLLEVATETRGVRGVFCRPEDFHNLFPNLPDGLTLFLIKHSKDELFIRWGRDDNDQLS